MSLSKLIQLPSALVTAALLSSLSLGTPSACAQEDPASPPQQETPNPAHQEQPSSGQQQTASPESFPDVVAKVNGKEIPKQALLGRARMIQSRLQVKEPPADFYQRVLQDLIGAELLYQSSVDRGLVPTDEEVDARVSALEARFPSSEVFDQQLTAQGLSRETLRDSMRQDLGIEKLIQADFAPQVSITDDEKKKFYQENQEQMTQPEQVKLSHILVGVEPNASAEDKAKAREKAEALRTRVVGGEDFATLARENSDDPGSKEQGGDLDWVSRGATVPPFEEAAFALSPGEISPVVETRFGYHIIKLAERKASSVVPYDQVEGRIEEFLSQQALQKRVESAVDTLKAKAKIDIFI